MALKSPRIFAMLKGCGQFGVLRGTAGTPAGVKMRRRTRVLGLVVLFVILVGFVVAVPAHAVDVMKKAPYLIYPGTPDQMEVLWQLSATATSTIAWGTDTSYGTGSSTNPEYGTDHQHAYTISGLAPATTYYYRITTDDASYSGSFLSAPAAGATQLNFLAYGDTRTYPAQHNQVAGAIRSALTADPSYKTFTLFMGDYVEQGCTDAYWQFEWFSASYPNIRALTAGLPYAGCMGNHETYPSGSTLFPKYFPYPFAGSRYYYSYDYGPVHVTVLDQYTAFDTLSTQGLWFKNDLAASNKTWKFVLLHEPGWSAGGHANNTTVQTEIEPICERYGVAVVFGGHNHYYARAVVNGVQHITTGGGGAPPMTPNLTQPNVVAGAAAYHYCQIAIDAGTLHFKAVNSVTGAMIDSLTLHRTIDTTPPVVAVTSPDGGEQYNVGSTHAVTWTAADSAGVDSVNVDYSLAGPAGPWLPVAHRLPNTGTCSWTLPGQPTDSALVRVTAYDHALNSGFDTSDSFFRIMDPAAVAGDAGPLALALARPSPNPSFGKALLRFSLPAAGSVRLDIVDLTGRRVWRREAELGAGAHAWYFDGSTERGRPLGSGLYFARLVTPWGTRTQRLVRLQ
jgi:hypothetical protein